MSIFEKMPTPEDKTIDSSSEEQTEEQDFKRGKFSRVAKDGTVNFYDTQEELIEANKEEIENLG